MITVLGAGGSVADEVVGVLTGRGEQVRRVSRNQPQSGGMAADLTDRDQAVRAVEGSSVALLLAGLKYDHKIWQEMWPRIMANTIEACERAGAKLIFLDNVYMYGKVDGAMTEETPFRPCSKKGEVRAQIATMLIREWQAGNITGLIARSADFYGPSCRNGVANLLVFDKLAKGKRAQWIGSESVAHSFTFAPDIGRALVSLMDSERAWNQTWHLPTASPALTGKQFVALAASELGGDARCQVISRTMLKMGGLFDANARESLEMVYQNEFPYVFDSSKFVKAFELPPTAYEEGIRVTAQGGALG
jgi:nucleoside-diphosphate-sugar epimerase